LSATSDSAVTPANLTPGFYRRLVRPKPHTDGIVDVHDPATGNTVNSNPPGFLGTRSTPPPTESKQVVKYVHLTEEAYFSNDAVTDKALIRGFDVCVPIRRPSPVSRCARLVEPDTEPLSPQT